jgi:hypothetical protein
VHPELLGSQGCPNAYPRTTKKRRIELRAIKKLLSKQRLTTIAMACSFSFV